MRSHFVKSDFNIEILRQNYCHNPDFNLKRKITHVAFTLV